MVQTVYTEMYRWVHDPESTQSDYSILRINIKSGNNVLQQDALMSLG